MYDKHIPINIRVKANRGSGEEIDRIFTRLGRRNHYDALFKRKLIYYVSPRRMLWCTWVARRYRRA